MTRPRQTAAPMHETAEPIHEWFDLSYSAYLVLPRSVLQSMPVEWQERMVRLLREATSATRHLDDMPGSYKCYAVDGRGKFRVDPYRDYERGRRRVDLRLVKS